VMKCNTPFTPSWVCEGRAAVGTKSDRNIDSRSKARERQPVLNSFSVPVQENILMEDLLYALEGISGKYIYCINNKDGESVFTIDTSTVDVSLALLASRLLPLCDYFKSCCFYIEKHSRYEFGVTSQAFSSAVKELLHEYSILVAQLETQKRENKLTLQKMWFYVQPSLRTLEILAKCCKEGEGKMGGDLINALYSVSLIGGDEKTESLMSYIMTRTCTPFLKMLSEWIYQGCINDPYDEFVVCQRKELGKDNLKEDFNANYWDER
jgi:gamma-tubulin complex component 2